LIYEISELFVHSYLDGETETMTFKEYDYNLGEQSLKIKNEFLK